MEHWFDVFKYEFRQQFRRKAYLFVTFLIPLLAIAAFFGYQAYRDSQDEEDTPANPITETAQDESKVIGYVDLTPNALFPAPDSYPEADCQFTATEVANLSPEVIKRLSSPYCVRNQIRYYPTQQAGKDAVDNDDIDVLYVIEPDYVTSGEVSGYMAGFSIEGATTDQWIEDYILASLLYNTDPATYEQLYLRLRDPAVVSEHILGSSGAATEQNEDQNFILIYGFGILLVMSLFWGGGYVMQSVVQEKESRVIEIILSSVRPYALLTGKILAMGLLSIIQVGMLIGSFLFIATQAGDVVSALEDVEIKATTLALVGVYFVLGFLFFGSLMAALGAIGTSMRDSQNYVTIITLPAMIPFFLLTMFAEEPNGTFAKVLSLIPITAPLSMVMRLAVTDVPALDLVLSLVILVLGVVGAIWLAGRVYRVNTLLMGNMPKLRDLPKLLRG